MTKKMWSLILGAALVASVFTIGPAKAEGQAAFFLRQPNCDGGTAYLSLTDGEDVDCGVLDSSLNEVYAESGLLDPSALYPAADGLPLVLGGGAPTGVISIRSFNNAGAGLAELDLTLVGESAGEEIVIATYSTSYQAIPATTHTFEYEMVPNEEAGDLTGKSFDAVTLKVFSHGVTLGVHGVIEHDTPPSLINIPTAAAGVPTGPPVAQEPPGKNDPPGQGNQNCAKIKNKKKKKECKKNSGKTPPGDNCAAYVPGEQGAEAESVSVTDGHTAEAPLELTIEQAMGMGDDLIVGQYDGTAHTFKNVQVDSKGTEAGLFIRYEFPEYEDHDLYVNYADGSEAAHVGGFNAVSAGPFDGTGSGGHSEHGAEQIDGLRTPDCGGYTVDFSNYLGEGGEYTVLMWLGEAENDPAAPAKAVK